MMLRIDCLLVFLAASAALAGLPGEGRGQPAPAHGADASEGDESPGHRLEARARKLADRGGRDGWARAASLYARAADQRGPADPTAADDLVMAGHLYYYAGDHEAAVLAFRTAGRMFVAFARLDMAAVAFRDGAWVAHRAGLERAAQELRQWSEVLTSPRPQGERRQRRFLTGAARMS